MSLPRFTFDLEDELQNLESEVANPANPANRDPNIRNIRNQADLNLEDNSGHITQGDHSWKDFHPDLVPADFEIPEMARGIAGKKIRGPMVGTVGFFIPWAKLEQGPTPPTKRKNSTTEKWNFSRLHIPSQTNPGKVDVWMIGIRDDGAERFWFVESREKTIPEKLTYRFQGRDFRLTDVGGHVIQKLLT